MTSTWHTQSWADKPLTQQAPYSDPLALGPILKRLGTLPPLVFPGEIDRLKQRLAEAVRGERFVLQGGDCAERFTDCREDTIANKFKILLQMSVVLTYGLKKPVVKIGRLAGQYGKPRSKAWEDSPLGQVPSFFGDNVNGYELAERNPDPARLELGYFHAAATLNYLRALVNGGFADLHHPQTWNLAALEPSPRMADYQGLIDRIGEAISFMESFGGVRSEELGSTEFYVSHEGLHLPWESAMVRQWEGAYYAASTHFIWIGERTRAIDGAHVEFFRGLANPVGVKLGPHSSPTEVLALAKILNPMNEEGKLVFISRMGAEGVVKALPPLVKAVEGEGIKALWISDPMHGNTESTIHGRKTRRFDRILEELARTVEVHGTLGSWLGGVHFELTGDDVTECLGGPASLTEDDLALRYETWCDPRLNYGQGLEMAFRLNELLSEPSHYSKR